MGGFQVGPFQINFQQEDSSDVVPTVPAGRIVRLPNKPAPLKVEVMATQRVFK